MKTQLKTFTKNKNMKQNSRLILAISLFLLGILIQCVLPQFTVLAHLSCFISGWCFGNYFFNKQYSE